MVPLPAEKVLAVLKVFADSVKFLRVTIKIKQSKDMSQWTHFQMIQIVCKDLPDGLDNLSDGLETSQRWIRKFPDGPETFQMFWKLMMDKSGICFNPQGMF